MTNRIRKALVVAVLAFTMLISACNDPITAVDNAVSPEGTNCGALIC